MHSIAFSLLFVCASSTLLCKSSASTPSVNASAEFRAQQTLSGLFNYYWKHDTRHKNVEYIFVCGQLGLLASPSTCTCQNPKVCVDCYRWWSAVALESIATYGIYTNSTNHSQVADIFFSHSPYNANWNATAACTYIDDFTWYGIAYLRVYEWLKVSPYWDNQMAHAFPPLLCYCLKNTVIVYTVLYLCLLECLYPRLSTCLLDYTTISFLCRHLIIHQYSIPKFYLHVN